MSPIKRPALAITAALLVGACSSSNTKGTTGGGGSGGSSATDAGGGAAGAGGGAAGAGGGVAGAGGGGGAAGGGGSGGSGNVDAQAPADGVSADMNFFVTSRGPGNGGNLGGLAGADAFCKTLATAVSAALGAKTWHAYLSTSTVNANTRIGTGPWRNAAGVIIASDLAVLHDQTTNGALNGTWPIGATNIALDEHGNEVPTTPQTALVHDILTGSNPDGTVMAGATCNDWTSAATTDIAEVGHTNRMGGGRPPSWTSAHTVGCAEPAGGADFSPNTVSSGGGRGSIYCFAVP